MQTNTYYKLSERELRKKLSAVESKELKFTSELKKLKSQIKLNAEQKYLIQDAIMEKWRQPSNELLQAISEVENGEVETYETLDDFKRAMND